MAPRPPGWLGRAPAAPWHASNGLYPHDDLADLSVGLHELDGGRQVVEPEDLVDDRHHPTLLEIRQHVPGEPADRLGALRRGAESVAHTEDREALAVQGFEIERGGHHAVHVAHRRQPTLEGERSDAFGE